MCDITLGKILCSPDNRIKIVFKTQVKMLKWKQKNEIK